MPTRRHTRRHRIRHTHRRSSRIQRGGALREDLVHHMIALPYFGDVQEFFSAMKSPVWHSQFPKKDGHTHIVLIKEGEVESDTDPQKLIAIIMHIENGHVEDVQIETSENKSVQFYLNNYPGSMLESGSVYSGIRGASRNLFDVGA